MLLLVINAELDQLRRPRLQVNCEETLKRRIDMLAIGAHLVGRGPCEQPALGARMAWAHALVIGVEAIFEALVEEWVDLKEGLEHEGFEEPGGVGEMPFGGTCIVIGLDDLVLVAQGPRQLRGEAASRDQAIVKRLSRGPMSVVEEDSIARAHNRLPGNASHIRPVRT